jgi:hypothetical protein
MLMYYLIEEHSKELMGICEIRESCHNTTISTLFTIQSSPLHWITECIGLTSLGRAIDKIKLKCSNSRRNLNSRPQHNLLIIIKCIINWAMRAGGIKNNIPLHNKPHNFKTPLLWEMWVVSFYFSLTEL